MTEKKQDTVIVHNRYRYVDFDRDKCNTLAKELDLPFPFAVLLWQRDIRSKSEAGDFLAPTLAALPSPFFMKDMEEGVSIIHQALQENWPIYIHGDYDVDGITASALLARFFKQIGKKTICYQPDRLTEGYGLQESFIRAKAPIPGKNALLVTVDCGISDFNEISVARELGFKVIVTDHHLPGDTLPHADAVINPQRQDCSFPFSSLAGVGVAFFLAYALRNTLVDKGNLKKEEAPNLKKLMDLVALGTVADVMPLIGVNRILVRAGLEVMNKPDCLWVEALRKQQKNNNFNEGPYTSEDISYRFAPRINAPGRLGTPGLAFELLSSDSPDECEELAIQIEELNHKRREHEIGTLEQVIDACKKQDDEGAAAFVVEGDFHQGVIGIIASRIVDMFQKPVIIFTEDTSRLGAFKGSGRSVEGINLYEVLDACSKAIIQFGGHAMAAGLAIHKDNLHFFTKQFRSAVAELGQEKVSSTSLIPIDFPVKPEEVLHKSFIEKYHHLQPFGNGNLEPVFLADKPKFTETAVVKNNHLTFSLNINGQVFRGIGFGMADKLQLIRKGPVQLAFKIKNTVYKGEKRVEMHAVDISPST